MSTTVYLQGRKPIGKYPKYVFLMSFVPANPLVTMLSTDTLEHAAFGGYATDLDRIPTTPSGYGAVGSGVTS